MADYRIEKDSMGEMKVPQSALWGASTQRAVENFQISGIKFPRQFIAALGLIKRASATVNNELGLISAEICEAITSTSKRVEQGELDDHFVVDIFQTGSGTSTNMNVNEVIANYIKTNLKLAAHPNDHVNASQSSNDVIPTAMHISAALGWQNELKPALVKLHKSLEDKSNEFSTIVKTGRTHLMDATPITLGQEFGGYAAQVKNSIERVERSLTSILELPLGGTAVGSGVNTHPNYASKTIQFIAKDTGLGFFEARNHFEAQAAKDGIQDFASALKGVAVALSKVANDIRFLGSGPRCGLGELLLPEVQPGSSIMPGKVNPVIAESLLMVCAQVIGFENTVTVSNQLGSNFELNVMMPVMTRSILESITLLAKGSDNFRTRCVEGIEPNLERIKFLAEANITIVTALVPKIGYDLSAKLSKEALSSNRSLREVVLESKVMTKDELDQALDLIKMTKPGL